MIDVCTYQRVQYVPKGLNLGRKEGTGGGEAILQIQRWRRRGPRFQSVCVMTRGGEGYKPLSSQAAQPHAMQHVRGPRQPVFC